MRRSDDPSVKSAYINPDLAPAEAKIAFESRQRRRELLSKRVTVNDFDNSCNITPKDTPAVTHIVGCCTRANAASCSFSDGVNDNGVHVAATAASSNDTNAAVGRSGLGLGYSHPPPPVDSVPFRTRPGAVSNVQRP